MIGGEGRTSYLFLLFFLLFLLLFLFFFLLLLLLLDDLLFDLLNLLLLYDIILTGRLLLAFGGLGVAGLLARSLSEPLGQLG